jgi:CheY-like chemotaxis protein
MNSSLTILIVDDDEGHAILVRQSLEEAGLGNPVLHFNDGQAALDFLFQRGPGPSRESGRPYLALLDIRMPKVDGVEVLRQIKSAPELQKLPVIMLTTTEDPREVDRCHMMGCNVYLQKPVDYEKFAEAIRNLGMFIKLVLVPPVNGAY